MAERNKEAARRRAETIANHRRRVLDLAQQVVDRHVEECRQAFGMAEDKVKEAALARYGSERAWIHFSDPLFMELRAALRNASPEVRQAAAEAVPAAFWPAGVPAPGKGRNGA